MGNTDFNRIFAENHRLVMAAAWRTIQDYQFCEDICQEVFTKLSNNMKNFRDKDPGEIRWWLLSVTRTTALDYRRMLRMDKLPVQAYEREDEETNPSTLQEPLRQLTNRESRREILDAMREHDPKGLKILVGIEIEGRSVTELAAQLEMTPNNLRTRLYRLRKWLKETFTREEGYF